jgi:hypothetical protein
MRRALHQRQEIDALDPRGSLDRRNEPMGDRAEVCKLGRSHLTEIEKMPPGLEYDRSRTGFLQRGVLDDEVLALHDVAPGAGDVQKLRPRFQAILLTADIAVRPVIIRRRTDFRWTLTGWLLPRRDGHSYPPFIADVHVVDDALAVGLFGLNPSALLSGSTGLRYLPKGTSNQTIESAYTWPLHGRYMAAQPGRPDLALACQTANTGTSLATTRTGTVPVRRSDQGGVRP